MGDASSCLSVHCLLTQIRLLLLLRRVILMNAQEPMLASHVSRVLIDGEGVLLNQKTGKYLGLNAVGTRILEMIQEGLRTEQITEKLAELYQVDRATVRRDVEKFLEQAAKHDLLVLSPAMGGARIAEDSSSGAAPVLSKDIPQDGAKARRRLVLHAYFLLFIIDWRLKSHSFETVLQWLNDRSGGAKPSRDVGAARIAIQQVRDAIGRATKFYYRTRRDCLPNAMLAYYLMKKRGVAVKFCIGVTKFPFKGHAWVEYEGKVVYTTPASLWKYRAIMKV